MATEVIFYFIGFLSCLLLLTVIVEVNDKDKRTKRTLRRAYRTQLAEQSLERAKEDIDIDIKIY